MENKEFVDLVQNIKEIVQAAFFDDKNLWTPDRCASYFGCSVEHFKARIAPRPDFPAPIALPTNSGKQPRNRWESDEVKAWAAKFRTKRASV